MKTIKNLDQTIRLIGIKLENVAPPTLREVLLTEVSLVMDVRGPQAIQLTRIGLKIMDAGADVELEDADFALLREVLRKPKQRGGIPVGHASVMIGAVDAVLEEVERGG